MSTDAGAVAEAAGEAKKLKAGLATGDCGGAGPVPCSAIRTFATCKRSRHAAARECVRLSSVCGRTRTQGMRRTVPNVLHGARLNHCRTPRCADPATQRTVSDA